METFHKDFSAICASVSLFLLLFHLVTAQDEGSWCERELNYICCSISNIFVFVQQITTWRIFTDKTGVQHTTHSTSQQLVLWMSQTEMVAPWKALIALSGALCLCGLCAAAKTSPNCDGTDYVEEIERRGTHGRQITCCWVWTKEFKQPAKPPLLHSLALGGCLRCGGW